MLMIKKVIKIIKKKVKNHQNIKNLKFIKSAFKIRNALNDEKVIYQKTDYLCSEKERICVCNFHAEDFRKIYSGINYKQGNKYISWIKKKNHFKVYDIK